MHNTHHKTEQAVGEKIYAHLRQNTRKVREWHLNTLIDQVLLIQALAGSISMNPSHGRPVQHTRLAAENTH